MCLVTRMHDGSNKVKWRGCEKLEWEREHLLVRDRCTEAMRDFWGLQLAKEFHTEPEGKHIQVHSLRAGI